MHGSLTMPMKLSAFAIPFYMNILQVLKVLRVIQFTLKQVLFIGAFSLGMV